MTRNGVTRVEGASPSLNKLVFSLCQLTATSFGTGDGGRTTVYSNMDDRIRGILTSIKALGSAFSGVRPSEEGSLGLAYVLLSNGVRFRKSRFTARRAGYLPRAHARTHMGEP